MAASDAQICPNCGASVTALRRICRQCRQPLPVRAPEPPEPPAERPREALPPAGAFPAAGGEAPAAVPPADPPALPVAASAAREPELFDHEGISSEARPRWRPLLPAAAGAALVLILVGMTWVMMKRPLRVRPSGAASAPRPVLTLPPRSARMLVIASASADSEAPGCPLASPKSSGLCSASLAVDGSTQTAWCEGVDGPGVGQRLTLRLGRDALVERVDIVSGALRPGVLSWEDIGRAAAIELSGRSTRLDVRLDLERHPPRQRIDLSPPWRTRELVITLREPRPGRKLTDTICLGEVTVWGTEVTTEATPPPHGGGN